MDNFKSKNVMTGSHGKVFIDGDHWSDVKAIKTEIEIDKDEVIMAGGQKGSKTKAVGGKGSMTFSKVYSREHKKFLDKIKNGQQVYFLLQMEVDDPDALGAEIFSIKDCDLEGSFPVLNAERGSLIEKEISFDFLPMNIEPEELV